MWLSFKFKRTTTDGILAGFHRTIAKLEAHIERSRALADFHEAKTQLHSDEEYAAAVVRGKLADLLGK